MIICSISFHDLFTILSPGMPEMLGPSAALIGANLGKSVALVTDGRFSGATHGTYAVFEYLCPL